MGRRIPRPCMSCGNLTPGTYCPTCQPAAHRERNRKRNEEHAPYRTTAWQRARAAALARDHGMCALCASTAHPSVHHIDHNTSNNQADNLVTLCRSCHGRLETEHQQGKHGQLHSELHAVLGARMRGRNPQ